MTQFPYLDIDDRVATIDTWFDFDQTDLVSAPDYGALKRSENRNKGITFGDAYKSSYIFGLNSLRPEWDMTFTVNIQSANDFEVVLTRYCGEKNTIVEWVPPDSSVVSNWRMDEWTAEKASQNCVKFSVTLRKVFELQLPELISIPTECEPDLICEQDDGNYDPGFYDVWIARLDGTVAQNLGLNYSYMTNAYTADDGYIYVVYLYDRTINITKFQQNGTVVWTRAYPGMWGANNYGYPGNDLLYLAGDETRGLLFIGFQGVFYPTNTMALSCVRMSDGLFQWQRYFVNEGGYNAYCGMLGATTQGQIFLLTSFPESDAVVFHGNASRSVFRGSTGEPITQYRSTSGAVFEHGRLGGQPYTVGNSNAGLCFWPGHTYVAPSTAYVLPDVSGGAGNLFGIWQNNVRFLGNGQLFVHFTARENRNKEEIIIFGEDMQKDVHVVFNGGVIGAMTRDWGEYVGGLVRTAAQQVYLDVFNQKIFIYYNTTLAGVKYLEFDVVVNNGKVVDILGRSRATNSGSQGLNAPFSAFGAAKYSANDVRYPRVTAAAGTKIYQTDSSEVCVFSARRGYGNTPEVNIPAGTESSAYMDTDPFYSVSTTFVPRINFTLQTGVVFGSTGSGSYGLPTDTACGSTFINTSITGVDTLDITGDRVFSVYRSGNTD
jgi:phage-related protein